eukprot:gene8827-6210_t
MDATEISQSRKWLKRLLLPRHLLSLSLFSSGFVAFFLFFSFFYLLNLCLGLCVSEHTHIHNNNNNNNNNNQTTIVHVCSYTVCCDWLAAPRLALSLPSSSFSFLCSGSAFPYIRIACSLFFVEFLRNEQQQQQHNNNKQQQTRELIIKKKKELLLPVMSGMVIRYTRVLRQFGGGVSMTHVPNNPLSQKHTGNLIQPTIQDASEAVDREALSARQRSLFARTFRREWNRRRGGGALLQSHTEHDRLATLQEGEEEEEEDEDDTPAPPLPREWRAVPKSVLSTAQTQRDWFRLMHFNLGVDQWSDYTTPTRYSAIKEPGGPNTVAPLADRRSWWARLMPWGRPRPSPTSAATPSKGEEERSGPPPAWKNTEAFRYVRTSPVVPPRIRVPVFLRRDLTGVVTTLEERSTNNTHEEGDKAGSAAASETGEGRRRVAQCSTPPSTVPYEDYDPAAHHCPPYLSREHRRQHLVQMIRAYDPDILTLNEVNREFFFDEVFTYVRFLGYGALYQSSRGARVRCLRPGDRPAQPKNRGKIGWQEDIGNVILFHKGRFVPVLSGGDYGKHFHFGHFAALRDRVTNLNVVVACVQLTAGNTKLAEAVRAHEAAQVMTLLDSFVRYDTDRAHQSVVVCGDLNNEHMEEPCVEVFRHKFFSTYDLAGGPRWTTWHYAEPYTSEAMAAAAAAAKAVNVQGGTSVPGAEIDPPPPLQRSCSPYACYTPYFRKNVEEFWRCHGASSSQRTVSQHMAYRQEAAEMVELLYKEQEAKQQKKRREKKLSAATPSLGPALDLSGAPSDAAHSGSADDVEKEVKVRQKARLRSDSAMVDAAANVSEEAPVETTTTTTTGFHEKASRCHPWTWLYPPSSATGSTQMTQQSEEGTSAAVQNETDAAATETALEKAGSDVERGRLGAGQQSVVRRTQDFIFYDPQSMALHQLLDTPTDAQIPTESLLPFHALPSHHLPLAVDISFNNPFPDVGEFCAAVKKEEKEEGHYQEERDAAPPYLPPNECYGYGGERTGYKLKTNKQTKKRRDRASYVRVRPLLQDLLSNAQLNCRRKLEKKRRRRSDSFLSPASIRIEGGGSQRVHLVPCVRAAGPLYACICPFHYLLLSYYYMALSRFQALVIHHSSVPSHHFYFCRSKISIIRTLGCLLLYLNHLGNQPTNPISHAVIPYFLRSRRSCSFTVRFFFWISISENNTTDIIIINNTNNFPFIFKEEGTIMSSQRNDHLIALDLTHDPSMTTLAQGMQEDERYTQFINACHFLFSQMLTIDAAEFSEAVAAAAADPLFFPSLSDWIAPPSASQGAGAGTVSCVRFQQAALHRHPQWYATFVGGASPYRGQWHVFLSEGLGLRCFTYGPKEYAAAPSLAVHIAANELRCCDGGAAGALAVWRDAVVGYGLRRIHLATGRLGLMDAAGGAGGAESRLERCGGGESCPGAALAAGRTKTARDASKWLSRCDGSGMVCQMSRTQLRFFIFKALQMLRAAHKGNYCPGARKSNYVPQRKNAAPEEDPSGLGYVAMTHDCPWFVPAMLQGIAAERQSCVRGRTRAVSSFSHMSREEIDAIHEFYPPSSSSLHSPAKCNNANPATATGSTDTRERCSDQKKKKNDEPTPSRTRAARTKQKRTCDAATSPNRTGSLQTDLRVDVEAAGRSQAPVRVAHEHGSSSILGTSIHTCRVLEKKPKRSSSRCSRVSLPKPFVPACTTGAASNLISHNLAGEGAVSSTSRVFNGRRDGGCLPLPSEGPPPRRLSQPFYTLEESSRGGSTLPRQLHLLYLYIRKEEGIQYISSSSLDLSVLMSALERQTTDSIHIWLPSALCGCTTSAVLTLCDKCRGDDACERFDDDRLDFGFVGGALHLYPRPTTTLLRRVCATGVRYVRRPDTPSVGCITRKQQRFCSLTTGLPLSGQGSTTTALMPAAWQSATKKGFSTPGSRIYTVLKRGGSTLIYIYIYIYKSPLDLHPLSSLFRDWVSEQYIYIYIYIYMCRSRSLGLFLFFFNQANKLLEYSTHSALVSGGVSDRFDSLSLSLCSSSMFICAHHLHMAVDSFFFGLFLTLFVSLSTLKTPPPSCAVTPAPLPLRSRGSTPHTNQSRADPGMSTPPRPAPTAGSAATTSNSGSSAAASNMPGPQNGGGTTTGASYKHLEFQLQRERSAVVNLTEKCKQYQIQLSQVEQEKAELRREKVSLAEENKRVARLEEHVAGLKRELEQRDKQLQAERQKAADAKAETEEIRTRAHTSIDQWTVAEAAWTEQEQKLQATVAQQREEINRLHAQLSAAHTERDEFHNLLRSAKEQTSQQAKQIAGFETELRQQYEQLEQHRSKVFAYETDSVNLHRAAEKLQEALQAKEEALQSRVAAHERCLLENEQLSQTVHTYVDRLNKEKAMQTDLKRQKELLACDIGVAKKEKERIEMQLHSERKERELAQQRLEQVEQLMEEMRDKCIKLQEEVRSKAAEVRDKELEVSQLEIRLQKYEAATTLAQTEQLRREKERDQHRRQVEELQTAQQELVETIRQLEGEVKHTRAALNKRDEEVVLVRVELEEVQAGHQAQLQKLMREVEARQVVIQNLHRELQELNRQQHQLHQNLTEEAKGAERASQERQALLDQLRHAQHEALLSQATLEKTQLCMEAVETDVVPGCMTLLVGPLVRDVARQGAELEREQERLLQRLAALEEQQADTTQLLRQEESKNQRICMENEQLRLQVEEEKSTARQASADAAWLQERLAEAQARQDAVEATCRGLQEEKAALAQSQAELAQRLQDQHRAQQVLRTARQLELTLSCMYQSTITSLEQKLQYTWDTATSLLERSYRELRGTRGQLAEAKQSNTNLEQLLRESNELFERKHLTTDEAQKALNGQVQLLERRLAQVSREKGQHEAQLHATLERWNLDKAAWTDREHELEAAARSEAAARVAVEASLRKVREGLEYELRRKVEYKEALAELKRLRSETDAAREKERGLATTAMEKANEEIAYWRKAFMKLRDKYKHSVKQHRLQQAIRTGPSLEPPDVPPAPSHSTAGTPPPAGEAIHQVYYCADGRISLPYAVPLGSAMAPTGGSLSRSPVPGHTAEDPSSVAWRRMKGATPSPPPPSSSTTMVAAAASVFPPQPSSEQQQLKSHALCAVPLGRGPSRRSDAVPRPSPSCSSGSSAGSPSSTYHDPRHPPHRAAIITTGSLPSGWTVGPPSSGGLPAQQKMQTQAGAASVPCRVTASTTSLPPPPRLGGLEQGWPAKAEDTPTQTTAPTSSTSTRGAWRVGGPGPGPAPTSPSPAPLHSKSDPLQESADGPRRDAVLRLRCVPALPLPPSPPLAEGEGGKRQLGGPGLRTVKDPNQFNGMGKRDVLGGNGDSGPGACGAAGRSQFKRLRFEGEEETRAAPPPSSGEKRNILYYKTSPPPTIPNPVEDEDEDEEKQPKQHTSGR